MTTTVADVMTRDPIVVQPHTPLNDVIKILAEQRISGLPVVNEAGTVVGVISEADLMWQEAGITPPAYIKILDSVIYLENPARYERELHKALGQTAGEVMTADPVTTSPDQPLHDAAQLMHERNVQRLPVLDHQGKIIGILTRGDIIRHMATQR